MEEHRTFEKKKREGQQGALIVEATISLTTFMFAMYILLSVIQMAYVQERLSVGLDRTAKEMAEYAHTLYALGISQKFSGEGGKSSQYANEASEMLKKIGNAVGSDLISGGADALEGDSISQLASKGIGVKLAEQMLPKNVVPGSDGKAGDFKGFLDKNNVDTWNLWGSNIHNEKIFLRIDYEIRLVQLLKIKKVFHVSHVSYARVWAGGK